MKNISKKTRQRNMPTKLMISTVIGRYLAASAEERTAIVNHFNWVVQNTKASELRSFHTEIRMRLLEVPQQ